VEPPWFTDRMKGYGPSTYGDRIADVYDDLYGDVLDTEGAVAALAELAAGGPVLELAIGTGRLALPLRDRGLDLSGIDASEAMVEKMRAKPGGAGVPVAFGDFAEVGVDGTFKLIFIAFNTFFALMTQEDQIRCFENVRRHLGDEGAFVLEAFVPDLSRFDRGQRVDATDVGLDHVRLDVSRHDMTTQVVESAHVVLRAGETRIFPIHIRYAWPSELDLMARLAGLRLRERWAGWRGEPFSSSSERHVSIYEPTAG
jgi:SAM-dependent methyltransferase